MNEQPVETTELEELDSIIEFEEKNIELGKDYEKLINNRQFKKIISKIFIEEGKDYLWRNIRSRKEEDLLEKGEARGESIKRMEIEVQARLILERFLESFRVDAEEAAAKIDEIKAARQKIIEEGEK